VRIYRSWASMALIRSVVTANQWFWAVTEVFDGLNGGLKILKAESASALTMPAAMRGESCIIFMSKR